MGNKIWNAVKKTARQVGEFACDHAELIGASIMAGICTSIVVPMVDDVAYKRGLGDGFIAGQENACKVISMSQPKA